MKDEVDIAVILDHSSCDWFFCLALAIGSCAWDLCLAHMLGSGVGLVLVLSWSGLGLVWSSIGLVLVWSWSGLGLVWSGLVLVRSCSGVPVCDAVPSLYYRWLWLPSLLCDTEFPDSSVT